MKDFYGKELAVGDKVLYGGGYSYLREGLIEKIADKYVSVRPYNSNGNDVTRTKYYHEVTGKWIDPYFHRKTEAGYYHKETGKLVPWEHQRTHFNQTKPGGWGYNSVPNPDYVPEELREYKRAEYKDYVKEIKLKGGTISVLYNSKGMVKLPVDA